MSAEGVDIDPEPARLRRGRAWLSSSNMEEVSTRESTPGKASGNAPVDGLQAAEEALRWAALGKLPTNNRLRTATLRSAVEGAEACGKRQYEHKEVDVRMLERSDRHEFIERILRVPEKDNERFLQKLRSRFHRVGMELQTVEVRFEHVSVEAKCHIGTRALPTLLNRAKNMVESAAGLLGMRLSKMTNHLILKDVSGIIKPSRMTLLLGPPSSGKTTLLLALAGKMDPKLKVEGDVTYNGYKLNEFVPQKTAAYISQNDVHTGEMTVRETLDFSARCQGPGHRYEFYVGLLSELEKRERDAGIIPDAEVDLFMKATAVEGVKSSLMTDYTLKILGLDNCADTIVGDDMSRGISGGQRKRLTTGEMIVGPNKAFFMDEISTGLDSSTTFQIVKCLQQIVHVNESTIVMSLLQPAPEIFELFDDIILISEGQIVYQGPRDHVLEFFESCGLRCPECKGTADFLQEVTSRKDQEQYWANTNESYRYIPVSEFAARFKAFHVGRTLEKELSEPLDKNTNNSHQAALAFSKYFVSSAEMLKACYAKEWLLIKRKSSVFIVKGFQIFISAIIASTMFLRTRLGTKTEADGAIYLGALLFSMTVHLYNQFIETGLVSARLSVFYKQRDLLLYPAWAFTLPNFLLMIPFSILESVIWVGMSYYTIGFAPEVSRFSKQVLLVFLIQQMAAGLYRFIAGVCRSMVVANSLGSLISFTVFVLGGFVIPREVIPKAFMWGYWISPLTYACNALAVNEMLAPRWMDQFAPDGRRLGVAVLENNNIFPDENWYWIGAGALLGFTILFNLLFTLSLMYLNPLGERQAVISEEVALEIKDPQNNANEKLGYKQDILAKNVNPTSNIVMGRFDAQSPEGCRRHDTSSAAANGLGPKKGTVLPFEPLGMSFKDVYYYVDMPTEMKREGVTKERLELLRGVTGDFKPGILTALMGVSGAGKTTLMDVLAGRKTGGYLEGDIRVSGYLKNQETFARISGYCEQNDVHSPQVTVWESLIYSAFLRLPEEVADEEKMKFAKEIMELVELDIIKDAIVGLPGVTGLSTEQRKRLTIAVELVANPSIVFMDEPTSGLDARAADIVMRTVRSTADTGRTVVCTIHQPSIHIFEAFDELLLMKRGGQVIYFGSLGRESREMIEYFQAIPGVPKIQPNDNPPTWMLEVSSAATEAELGIDFTEHYRSSNLCKRNRQLVEELRIPFLGSRDLLFPTKYAQSTLGQFKLCLWKQWWTYWRSPDYNFERLFITLVSALLIGTIFWGLATKRENSMDLRIITGAMYSAVVFVGIANCSMVQPVIAVERTVFYRERAAGMYSALPYAIAQVVVEVPYVFIQSSYYTFIIYSFMGFEWTIVKFSWFFLISFFTFLLYTFYGMMTLSISPTYEVAAIVVSSFFLLFDLFAGFFVTLPNIPAYWVWYYWICPVAWTVYGLIVTQYGDLADVIKVPGLPDQPIKLYVKEQLGYHPEFMGVVAMALLGFTIFFAFTYAVSMKTLNFQRR